MRRKTRRFVMNMPEDLAKALHNIASVQNVTMSQICADALADFFARGAMPAIDE
jgi:predicted transcriptional regulator